jgi:hypothetical protein
MSNDNSVQVRVEWIVEDLLNAVKAIRAKQRFKNNLNYSIAFVLGLLGIGMLRLGALQEPVFGFIAIVCLVYVVLIATGGLQSQLRARRMFKKNPERFAPCEVTIDDEGFREQSSTSDVRVPWSAVTSVEESEHAFALNLKTKQQMIVPKRVFLPKELQTVRRIFSQHVVTSPASK